jgi:hypothetical protein
VPCTSWRPPPAAYRMDIRPGSPWVCSALLPPDR